MSKALRVNAQQFRRLRHIPVCDHCEVPLLWDLLAAGGCIAWCPECQHMTPIALDEPKPVQRYKLVLC